MKKAAVLGMVLAGMVLVFQSCLDKEERYQCPTNRKNYMTLTVDGTYMTPDDYTTGGVLSIIENDSIHRTFVEMSFINSGKSYTLFMKMDTLSGTGVDYATATGGVRESHIVIDNDKFPLVVSKAHFTDLSGFVPSNFDNLYYYGIGKGTVEGKFLRSGASDSSTFSGTFCYDDEPDKK